MAAIDSNRALHKPPGQLQDAPDALVYLKLVRSLLQMDWSTLYSFLLQVQHWSRYQEPDVSRERDLHTRECVIEMAKILRFHPKLVSGLNALLPHGRLECSTAVEEVKFFVLVDSSGARILGTSYSEYPIEFTDQNLRKIVIFEECWAPFLKDNSDRDWLTCVSELLKFILDDPSTEPFCKRRAYRCLRELAILPPSTLIRNVEHASCPPTKEAGGGYADIYKGYVGNTRVCIRVLKPKKDPENMAKAGNFCTEVLVWSQLRHPNILPFWGASIDLFASTLCFVTPWIPNGNLMEYLKVNPDHDRYTSICEIVEGIKYLHEEDPPVAHRDIKGSNVLVRDDGVCYLADFGLSSIEEEHKLVQSSPSFKGTLNWAAPEVFYPPMSGERNHRAADVYALGCTIYEIYMGVPPHWGKLPLVVSKLVGSDAERPSLPPVGKWTDQELSLWWLVGLCWEANPQSRPDINLVKGYLRDTGDFKPSPMHEHSLHSVTDSAAQKDFGDILDQIKIWLEHELNLATNLSPSQSKLVDDSLEVSEYNEAFYTPKRGPDWMMQMTAQISRQPFGPLQLNTGGTQPATYANFQGLFTPDTPSIPLEALCLQREYVTTPEPSSTSFHQTISIPGTLTVLTPPSTPFRLRVHSFRDCVVAGKSPVIALRTEAQMFETQTNFSPPQLDTQVPMSKPMAAPFPSTPTHYERRPLNNDAQISQTTTAVLPYQPTAQASAPKSKLPFLVINPAHRYMKLAGPRTYASSSSFCSSPLSESMPSIVRPTNCNPKFSIASRGQRFLDSATTPSVPEGSEPSRPTLRTPLRPNESSGLSLGSSIVIVQDDHDDEYQMPRFRRGH